MFIPVILAGGVGSRLWPLSREHFPKQFLPLVAENASLLQATLTRFTKVAETSAPYVICNEDHRFLVAEQVRELGIPDARIILEPCARNTAPAIAIAAQIALDDNPDAVLLVLPADHVLDTTGEVFKEALTAAEQAAARGKLVTFGIQPTIAETGYGYIKKGQLIEKGVFEVSAFVEKPDFDTATQYLDSGDYLWNSGMFMFKASAFLAELENHAPDIYQACQKAVKDTRQDLDFIRLDQQAFAASPSDSVDYAVMEKTRLAAVVPITNAWNDIGAWAALSDMSDKDEAGNTLKGDVLIEQTTNCYIRSESRLIATVGVSDLIVVETGDAVLVADKNSVQQVKQIVNRLTADNRTEATDHVRVYRPWGAYESIVSGERFQAKRIIVKPGAALSLQLHHHRAEHWIVVKGRARVTCDDKVFELNEDQSTYIPIGSKHRLENPGKIPLELIEVQSGSYLGEDDIIRFEDVYGRSQS